MSAGRKKIRRGLYKLEGVTHTTHYGVSCGGQVFAESLSGGWECYCEKCKACDPNGWPTLADCVREAPGYWCRLATITPVE